MSTDTRLQALRASVERLRALVAGMDDAQLIVAAYPSEWTMADVLSHIGSGAVIMQRGLDDGLLGQPAPADFAPKVWDAWNAKTPRSKGDDALVADASLLERIESLTSDEQRRFHFAMGPMDLDLDGFVGMRLNEHALHTWDIEVVLDPAAVVPAEVAAFVVDNLDLIARFTAKPTGASRTIAVRTTEPRRDFTISLAPDTVTVTPGDPGLEPDLELPAEAFARLIYGRLDSAHTPSLRGDVSTVEALRRAFPGP